MAMLCKLGRKFKSPFKKIARRSYEKSSVYMYLELSCLVILYNDISEFFDPAALPREIPHIPHSQTSNTEIAENTKYSRTHSLFYFLLR